MTATSVTEFFRALNGLDYLLLAILASSIIASLVRGFTREIAGLVALILGIILGLWFHGVAGAVFRDYVSSPEIASMVGFGLIFLGVVALGGLAGLVISKVLKVAGLSLFDRLLGGAFGLAKGMLFGAVIVFALLAFTPSGSSGLVSRSQVAPYVLWSANVLAFLAPHDVKTVVFEKAAQIEAVWRERAPELPRLPNASDSASAQSNGDSSPKRSPMGN